MDKVLMNHLELPSKCFCGDKLEYWVDGTYGCKKGHVIARMRNTWLGPEWFWVPVKEIFEQMQGCE